MNYDDKPITFSDEEWRVMLSDPAFGYVCRQGHSQARWNQYQQWDGTCYTCEAEMEAFHDEEISLDAPEDIR